VGQALAADAMTLAYKDLPQQGRLLTIMHEVLAAWGDDIDGCIRMHEEHPDETIPAVLVMLRLIKQRRKSGQFLPKRHRSASGD
jgi:hypothetical protein